MGRSRSRSRFESPNRRRRREESRRRRSPARRERSRERSNKDTKKREQHWSKSASSTSSRHKRRNTSRDREERRYEFSYNKPALDNRAWFTVELHDELYALRREFDRLKKWVDKLSYEFNTESERRADIVTNEKLKQALNATVQEAATTLAGKKAGEGSSQQASGDKVKVSDNTKVATKLQTLKKQFEDVWSMRYDIASLKGSLSSLKAPARREFVAPRQVMANRKTPIKKITLKPNEAGPSKARKKSQPGKDPWRSARHMSARRRILQGKQISEDMLSALQMDDLKQLCAMHNVRYRGIQQAQVALRKISGLIVSDTEDLLDKNKTGRKRKEVNQTTSNRRNPGLKKTKKAHRTKLKSNSPKDH
ncbi:hypothetical protein CBR_g34332 [Chara braunii]|uniref:Uncharacterized protein n=1 Tax=Chara braunii TaxID=69332 RepID=A0A388LII7_CHABU|nr:hypothetical protein CBR_g34332 [Chara braunii]|eukprot:GBG82053.1 hypothetical protein CBR_g34332 [Chara braunii]